MKLHFSYSTLDEIQRFAHALVDAHPVGLTLEINGMSAGKTEPPRPPIARSDDELTLHDLGLYEAGRFHVYRNLVETGLFTLDQAAEIMDLDRDHLADIQHIWENGEIVERRDAMCELLMRNAARDTGKESELNE